MKESYAGQAWPDHDTKVTGPPLNLNSMDRSESDSSNW